MVSGKYNYIYLFFYFLLKQDKLGLCVLFLLCVYESSSVRVRELFLYFFMGIPIFVNIKKHKKKSKNGLCHRKTGLKKITKKK